MNGDQVVKNFVKSRSDLMGSFQLSVISYQLSVPLAEARGLSSGIFSFFIPLKGEAHTHNFSVTSKLEDRYIKEFTG